jgi:hypothetical protein
VLALGLCLGATTMGACAKANVAATTGSGGGFTGCTNGQTQPCTCGMTQMMQGMQTCDNGMWAACACNMGPAVCGDGVCQSPETCDTCPADCGMCPACAFSPSCTGASSVPANPMALASFNNAGQTMFSSGMGFTDPGAVAACSYPLLKMRLAQVVVHKNGTPGKLDLFCIVSADDGQSSQLVATQLFMGLSDNNAPLVILPGAGTFWGNAINGVKLSQFNVTVTYQCYMVLQPSALQNALMAIAGYSGMIAGIPGNPYGWAFGLGGAAAAAAAAASAIGMGAVPLLDVQQTINSDALLKLTNGYTWSIEQKGTTTANGHCNVFSSCDWDWELGIEAWGCAAPKGQQPTM